MNNSNTAYSSKASGLYFFVVTLADYKTKLVVKNDYEGISEDEAWNGGGNTAYEDTLEQLQATGLDFSFLNEQSPSENCPTRQKLTGWFKPESGFFDHGTIKLAFLK
jgi:hypothetical protein